MATTMKPKAAMVVESKPKSSNDDDYDCWNVDKGLTKNSQNVNTGRLMKYQEQKVNNDVNINLTLMPWKTIQFFDVFIDRSVI